MPTRHKYFGPSVSRYLDPKERSWDTIVSGKGKLVLDAELILKQDLQDLERVRQLARQVPSGWVRGQARGDAYEDFSFNEPWLPGPVLNPDFVPNAFHMKKVQALVAGMLLDVEYVNTDTVGANLIVLDPPVGAPNPIDVKRTDFVFLEVWLALVSESPNAKGTLLVQDPVAVNPGDTVTVDGTVFTAVLAPPGALQFQIAPLNPAITAQNLANVINTNLTSVTAVADANNVRITATEPGAVGNTITLDSSNPTGILASGGFLTGGADTTNKPTQGTVYRHGNVQAPDDVALEDDLMDPDVGAETTKRVQIQYRIRHTGVAEGVNFKIQADGFSNPNILAQGTQASPVASYPFVPADLKTVIDNSDARDGATEGYGILDNGLWIAGNGTEASAADLGTIDGFVYAVPLCMVFRRNLDGFDPVDNTTGALLHDHIGVTNPHLFEDVEVGESDRPDGVFADQIVNEDLLDLRRHVRLSGTDFAAELQYQMQALQDGNFRTWAIDTASKQQLGALSGDISTRNLVANEIGRTAAAGGNPPLSGDTTRGETIRNFDHVARRFADQPVVERVVLALLPADDQGTHPGKYVVRPAFAAGFSGWVEGDEINVDLDNLNVTTLGDFDPNNVESLPGPGGVFTAFAPPGTTITDVLSIYHDDGNWNNVVDQTVKATTVFGLGSPHVQITLDQNLTQVTGGINAAEHDMVGTQVSGDVGSPRRVFVELEITYPLGVGTTDTPDLEITPDEGPWPYGPMLENWLPTGPDQRPLDMEDRLAPSFRSGFREVAIEYVANDPSGGGGNEGVYITTTVVSRDPTNLVLDRRFYGDATTSVGVTDQEDSNIRVVDDDSSDYGSSTRHVVLEDPLSGAGQTLCEVRYFAQDPVPNFGPAGAGYQQTIYFRTNAPQTVGVKEGVLSTTIEDFPYPMTVASLPSTLRVEPVYVSPNVWTGQVGMGSVELPFPYYAPLDQLPVNDGRTEVPPLPLMFPGEHYFAATANISIDDFDAEVGTLALHSLVPADGSTSWTLGGTPTTDEPFADTEFRAVFPVINRESHRPTAMAQGMSNVVRHKVFVPVLARSLQDSALFRKDEILLLVITRWAILDADNDVTFADSGSTTGVGVFRTKNLLMTAGNQE